MLTPRFSYLLLCLRDKDVVLLPPEASDGPGPPPPPPPKPTPTTPADEAADCSWWCWWWWWWWCGWWWYMLLCIPMPMSWQDGCCGCWCWCWCWCCTTCGVRPRELRHKAMAILLYSTCNANGFVKFIIQISLRNKGRFYAKSFSILIKFLRRNWKMESLKKWSDIYTSINHFFNRRRKIIS